MLPAAAVDTLELHLERLSGADWEAQAVTLAIDWPGGDAARIGLTVGRLSHPALPRPLAQVRLDCEQAEIDDQSVICRKGKAHLPHPDLDQPDIPLSFRWQPHTQTLDLLLEPLHLASGRLRLALHASPDEWRLLVQGKAVDLAKARVIAAPYLPPNTDFDLTGQGQLHALIVGDSAGPAHMIWDLYYTKLGFSDAAGAYVGEELAGRWQGDWRRSESQLWRGGQSLDLQQGALLTPFFYLEPKAEAVSVRADIQHDAQARRLDITQLSYSQPGLLQLELAAGLALGEAVTIERLRLQAPAFELQPVYAGHIQPTQAEPPWSNLRWRGRAALSVDYVAQGSQRVVLDLSEAAVEEIPQPGEDGAPTPPSRFGLDGVDAHLVWTEGRAAEPSTLSWTRGHLLERIGLGRAALHFQLADRRAELLQPADLPLLDGKLRLQRLFYAQGETGPRLEFDGALEPISMEVFSQAVGWPTLAGKLAGRIGNARYEQDVLSVDGSIVINVFDGVTIIDNLRLTGLFGVWPRLAADLHFQGLDLETLTRTFSFGRITGRLEGQVAGLSLENWRPVAFDARFATPDNDRSRRRISQRAVDNIANLGGSGISGAVSRSFLRFFDEFGYDRLGISCRLRDGVCEMGGVADANGGYYLVQGGGIPRIDIVGYNRRIDWELLVRKLVEISRSGPLLIE